MCGSQIFIDGLAMADALCTQPQMRGATDARTPRLVEVSCPPFLFQILELNLYELEQMLPVRRVTTRSPETAFTIHAKTRSDKSSSGLLQKICVCSEETLVLAVFPCRVLRTHPGSRVCLTQRMRGSEHVSGSV